MAHVALRSRGETQQRSFVGNTVRSTRHEDAAHAWRTLGERSSLVEDHYTARRERLERLTRAKQHAALCREARRHERCGGRRQPEGARAGTDENVHGKAQTDESAWGQRRRSAKRCACSRRGGDGGWEHARPRGCPECERCRRGCRDAPHKGTCRGIRKSLHGSRLRLRLLDQARDARHLRFGACSRGAHRHGRSPRDGARAHDRTLRLADQPPFARQVALIE